MIPATVHGSSRGNNYLIVGMVLAAVTFWLFAQTVPRDNPGVGR